MIIQVTDRERAQATELETLRQEITAWSVTAENLEAELERERIRLAACGVVAMADTPDSAIAARKMLPEYESGSCDDVKRRVDECMALRVERDALNEAVKGLTAQGVSLAADAARYQWLREGNDAKHGAAWHVAVNLYGCEWDAAIDAAMKEANHD